MRPSSGSIAVSYFSQCRLATFRPFEFHTARRQPGRIRYLHCGEIYQSISFGSTLGECGNEHAGRRRTYQRLQSVPEVKEDISSEYIFVRSDYKLNKIRVLDIYYIEAKKDYVNIHTSDNVYMVHSTMRDIIGVLPALRFIRIHRSYIVNIDKIFSIKYPDLLVENKMKMLPIGGLYRKELFDRLNVI